MDEGSPHLATAGVPRKRGSREVECGEPVSSLRERLLRPHTENNREISLTGNSYSLRPDNRERIGRGEREGDWAELPVRVRKPLTNVTLGGKEGTFCREETAAPHLSDH